MKYELLYIVPTSFSDSEVEGIQKKVAEIVTEAGGTISRDEAIGKIKLAYPIKKQRHGTYILVQFEAEPSALKPLDAKLRLTDEALRHTVAKMPAGAEDKKYELASYVAPLSTEGRPVRQIKPAALKLAPPPPTKTDETAPKMTVEELDKKLDEILDSDVLKDI